MGLEQDGFVGVSLPRSVLRILAEEKAVEVARPKALREQAEAVRQVRITLDLADG